jgi:hypothetical protein
VVDFDDLKANDRPFRHWVAPQFISQELLAEINAAWPPADDDRWDHEKGVAATKSAILFPQRLSDPAQRLAEHLMAPAACARLSEITGLELLPDPWFLEGPLNPKLGGGLHEIHPGGLLKMHIDFNRHPAGLVRVLNLLIYLNLSWHRTWGGALELHGADTKSILPRGATAVMFETTPQSWHGHPHPLMCPPGTTRRSLALYYYTRTATADREKTVYRK